MAAASRIAEKLAAAPSPARSKAKGLFLEVCRSLPWIFKNYGLDEICTISELRRKVGDKFRVYSDVTNPKTIDVLIYKGREELALYLDHHKQRHHLLTEYIEKDAMPQKLRSAVPESHFLRGFYESNYKSPAPP